YEHAAAQKKLDAYRDENLAVQQQNYAAYLTAYPAWQQKAGEADVWLRKVIPNLEARGLLQYDADSGLIDMHPAIRHTALINLSPKVKSRTGSHVSDALSSRTVKPLEEA